MNTFGVLAAKSLKDQFQITQYPGFKGRVNKRKPENLLKRDSNTCFPVNSAEISKSTYFAKHLRTAVSMGCINLFNTKGCTTLKKSSLIYYYYHFLSLRFLKSQLAFTCSKSTIETLEQGVKYVHS